TRLPATTSAAVLIVDARTMAVRAYVGSGTYGDAARAGHVDMIGARRSPGSTLKPLLYGLAVDDGLIHSQSLLVDAPQSFDGYRPANFDSGFRGPVSAADALRLSLNVPAVDLLQRLGPARFSARLAHAGIDLQLPRGAQPNLAMILGGTATTLEELVVAFSALARDGLAGRLRFRPEQPLAERRLMSAQAAFIVRQMLMEPATPGSIAGALARPSRLIAKTGTSWGYRDAWAIGVQPDWVLGVWLGRPDGTPSPGQYGAVTALPLLQSLAAALPGQATGFSQPPGVSSQTICWPLGTTPDPQRPALCHQQRQAWTLEGVVPATLPDRNTGTAGPVLTWLRDGDGRRRVPACAQGQALEPVQLARWPLLAGPWLDSHARQLGQLPAWAAPCHAQASEPMRGLGLSGLHDGTRLKTAPGHEGGEAWLIAAAHGGNGEIWWLVDDRLVGTTADGGRQRLVFPGPGSYRVVALDRSGSHASATVQVLP
ncbi:MAG: penicillin-binding transpeptidase domain-containing protein, partial [Lysobacterales bacterium]